MSDNARNSSDGWLFIMPEDHGQNDYDSWAESPPSRYWLPTTPLSNIPKGDGLLSQPQGDCHDLDSTPQNLPPFYSLSPPTMSSEVEEDVELNFSTLVEYSSVPW